MAFYCGGKHNVLQLQIKLSAAFEIGTLEGGKLGLNWVCFGTL